MSAVDLCRMRLAQIARQQAAEAAEDVFSAQEAQLRRLQREHELLAARLDRWGGPHSQQEACHAHRPRLAMRCSCRGAGLAA